MISRAARLRVTQLKNHCDITSTRFSNRARYRMWMNTHASHATNPLNRIPPLCATAFPDPIVASIPLSQ